MITGEGKVYIKRFLAGHVPSIAQSVAFGVGHRAESVLDDRLQFEVGREDIELTSYNFATDKLIFKAPLTEEFGGTIYEVALFSEASDVVAGESSAKLITSFDSETEEWVTGVYGTGSSRVGLDSLRQSPALSTAVSNALQEIFLDLAAYSGADKFVLALNASNTNVASIQIIFKTDISNYYTITYPTVLSGYQILEVTKSSAVATGTPSWANITTLEVITTAKAAGATVVDLDGLRIEDIDTINENYVMVARELLSVPYVKDDNMTQDIEFSLAVTV